MIHADKEFERYENITPEVLKRENVKLLLCDLDNTTRLHSEKLPSDSLKKWVKTCKDAGASVMIVSNNGRKRLMKRFCEPLGIDCVWWAFKPFTCKLDKVIENSKIPKKQIVMLGDKWSTDVFAANRAGIRAWKVKHRRNIK